MDADDRFSRWAALFLRTVGERGDAAPDDGLTSEARELLRSVDAGGIPAFVTGNLLRIAAENGVEVAPQWTPNEIVAAIRARRRTDGPATEAGGG